MSGIKSIVLICGLTLTAGSAFAQNWVDHSTSDDTTVVKRHETGSVVSGNKLYVLGGRGNKPVQVFDSSQNKWSTLAPLPMEMHHFQPVVLNGYIYVIGAFTCCYPTETSIADIYRLNIASNTWETFGTMPSARLRGAAGTVVHNNKIYLIGGNNNGHSGGAVGWFDEYDPATGNWTILPDAPNARDHFSAAMIGNHLVAAAGRQTNKSFGGMVGATDVFNFNTGQWTTRDSIPTPRAGTMLGVKNGNVIIIGGETDTQLEAHDQVEAYHLASDEWRTLPSLDQGRHGGAGGVIGNTLHAITGNLFRGGGQEVTLHEKLNVSDSDNDGLFNFEDNNNSATGNSGNGSNAGIADSDNDGLTDAQEVSLQTDPQNRDTDSDTLSDGEEVNQHNTDPLNQDTDSDGLTDAEEISYSTNPLQADSDADGLSDIDELQTYKTNPSQRDTDADTLSDKDELELYFTDPLLTDSDNDGLADNVEINTYNSDPNAWDSDGDGISDATEAAEGTTLTNDDHDGDGILNSAEGAGDPDGDSVPNFRDLDSDNDGIADILENGRTDDDFNGQLDLPTDSATDSLFDSDQDGIANILDIDSDQDGLTDMLESGQPDLSGTGRVPATEFIDSNQNGWHDAFEGTVPNDTDADATPDYLDLDSDDDGITDIAASGVTDNDDNGMIDTFTDTNGDGLHDNIDGLGRTGSVTGSTDGEQETSGGGASDPSLLLWVVVSIAVGLRRRHPFRILS